MMRPLSEFLQGKTLLITGATGFLAKAFAEKILREAPQVSRLNLLIRPRPGDADAQDSVERRLVREVINSSVFDRLRREKGDAEFDRFAREKLTAVAGDLTADNLGIAPDLRNRLAAETDIVVNSAATVVFDEPLDDAVALNTIGASRVAAFARQCKDAALVHVSTAYVSGQRAGKITESPLPPGCAIFPGAFNLDDEIAAVAEFARKIEKESRRPDNQAKIRRAAARAKRSENSLRKKWLREKMVKRGLTRGKELGWHDSYTFTKAMGEQIVVRDRGKTPLAIVRPSIIESSVREPSPGWLDGLKVTDPLIVHYGKGRLPDFPADPEAVIDIIPVDLVVNAMLIAMLGARESERPLVCHVAAGSRNPVRVRQIFEWTRDYFAENPMRDGGGRPITPPHWKFPSMAEFRRRFRRYQIPLSLFLKMTEKIPLPWPERWKNRATKLSAAVDNLLYLTELYGPYATLRCEFQTEELHRLHNSLAESDRERLNCDVSQIDWRRYFQEIHIPGLKRHVLKMEDDEIADAPGASSPPALQTDWD